MFDRRSSLGILALAAALSVAPAFAASLQPFGTANFEAARGKGAVIALIDASWCPTCRAQKPIVTKLLADPKFAKVAAFAIDYDSEKPTLKALNAPDRSTILVFKGGKEVGRSVGDTREETIAALLEKAL
ncbi:thioredoxin family protein [Chenggangzhangella methanolivorans]|uniref:Thioredoxin family protein n=1 Tax=Chenggangzhangella methanolivorans TaxID=1437009 RepID=A0A9E6RAB4_9HYPH|nr:thioredoxin family protein [Chenggangzhangella methanolivorans]QZO00165.1 thioredoxin family protein [Chenggangzhangella methanolivorans]